jgi:hypothetical protein
MPSSSVRSIAATSGWPRLLLAISRSSRSRMLYSVHLYGECGSPKFERAAIKWLQRYLAEGSPELSDIAKVMAGLVERREAPYG